MSSIDRIHAIEILDSRGCPTVYAEVITESGAKGGACVPSGASTGEYEAHELRDQEERYFGKGVRKAVYHINEPIQHALKKISVTDQVQIDETLIALDGTKDKSHLGANAILAVSLAAARAAATFLKIPLYQYLEKTAFHRLPCPMINVINGGAHSDSPLEFQEFMICPIKAASFAEAIQYSAEVFYCLKKELAWQGYSTSVGDEGGFAPGFDSDEKALEFLMKAIEKAGFKPGVDFSLALDCAASEFYDSQAKVYIEKKKKQRNLPYFQKTSEEMIEHLSRLLLQFPIQSIEDPLDQNDWLGWQKLTKVLGNKVQLVGDDLFVTHTDFLNKGIDMQVANAILIKCNQIGTLTEVQKAISLAQKNKYQIVISHRSGETEDTFIADLSVACGAEWIKTGSMSRSERIAKYNRLLMIESENSSLSYQVS